MCQSPIRILIAEDNADRLRQLKHLIAQIPTGQYQVTLAHTHEFFQYLADHVHDIYLVSDAIEQSPNFISLYGDASDGQCPPVILLRSELQGRECSQSGLEYPSRTSTALQSRWFALNVQSLTPTSLDIEIQAVLDRSQQLKLQQFNQPVVHLQDNLKEKKAVTRLNMDWESQIERFWLAFQGEGDNLWDWDFTTDTVLLFPACPWLEEPCSDRTPSVQAAEPVAVDRSHLELLQKPLPAEINAAKSDPEQASLAASATTCCASKAWLDRIHPQDLPNVQRDIANHLAGQNTRFASKHRFLQQDGNYCWVLSRGQVVRNPAGEPVRMVGIQTDISYWKRNQTKAVQETLRDPLTGLPNRVALMDSLRQAGARAGHQPDFLFAVLFIDLDRFKMINDSLGHRVGDQLLVSIAQRLAARLGPEDTIARLGSDEFVIVLQDIQSPEQTLAMTETLLQELTVPFCIEGRDIFTSASIGIALSSTGFIHPENLLRDADLAMYRAKTEGRGRYALFHPRMHTSAVAMLELETDLRRALERDELELHYQPIVSLRTNRLVGFEALVRWQHPQQGLISPVKFIPIAEETGLIQPIGHWVLRQACLQMRRWQQEFPAWQPLTMNVNLSGYQFTPQLADQVRQTLAETELAGQYLKLEITESVLMSHAEAAIATLSHLKELGIQLAIDDFGTGYSSLSYLHRFPIDTLKVDRSFIQRIDVDGEQLAIVRTIITLAWNLGMEVVAEGVETSRQLAQLRALRCEYAQGYLFSKPRTVKGVETLFTQELIDQQFDPFGTHRAG